MKRQRIIAISILCMAIMSPVFLAGAIDWIQYNERMAGENSPLYDDVLNRPAKQIWGIYTSEHHPDGTHKVFPAIPTPLPTATPVIIPTPLPTPTPVIIPTPLPTPTPAPANALIDWTNATQDFYT